jgi:phosphoribosyl-AMP cyclohydrolase
MQIKLSEQAQNTLRWEANGGLIAAIVQDVHTNKVLMLAYMNRDALNKTLEIGETVFWSRSRQELWHKGTTSNSRQKVVDIRVDCDGDTLLIFVEPQGSACHTGAETCFFRTLSEFNEKPERL